MTRLFIILIFALWQYQLVTSQNLKKAFADAEKQTNVMLTEIQKARELQPKKDSILLFPCSLTPAGGLKLIASKDWRSGFYPGILWYLFDFTGKNKWKKKAEEFTASIEKEKWNSTTHDMGFKIYCSFGNGFRLTQNQTYRDVIIQSAKTNSKRFNPKIGSIRSWDHSCDKWDFPVIIDNMMNLELLFAATRMTGDSSFYRIAIAHANTTMKNHFRPNFSSYHVIDYDTITGAVKRKNTHQGYGHESAWARGQAWGDKYHTPVGTSHGFILLHSTGNKPSNSDVDVPINYADYYYLEALLRSKKIGK